MKHTATSKVVDLLLDTLERVERRTGAHPDDAAMKNLRLHVFRLVAKFEAEKSGDGAGAANRQ